MEISAGRIKTLTPDNNSLPHQISKATTFYTQIEKPRYAGDTTRDIHYSIVKKIIINKYLWNWNKSSWYRQTCGSLNEGIYIFENDTTS